MSPVYLQQDSTVLRDVHQTTVHSVCYLHVSIYMYVYSCSITAYAIATSCCISDVPSQWEGRNFDPHSAHIFQPILMKLEIKKISWIRPHRQNLVDVGRQRGGLRRESIFCLCSILFCILAHAYRSHQKTDHDHL